MTSHLNGTEALGSEPALALIGDVAPLPVEELNNDSSVALTDRCVELCQRTCRACTIMQMEIGIVAALSKLRISHFTMKL